MFKIFQMFIYKRNFAQIDRLPPRCFYYFAVTVTKCNSINPAQHIIRDLISGHFLFRLYICVTQCMKSQFAFSFHYTGNFRQSSNYIRCVIRNFRAAGPNLKIRTDFFYFPDQFFNIF